MSDPVQKPSESPGGPLNFLVSGTGLWGVPILGLSLWKLMPLTLAVLRGEPMASPAVGLLAGPIGVALGVWLIWSGYKKASKPGGKA